MGRVWTYALIDFLMVDRTHAAGYGQTQMYQTGTIEVIANR